VSKRKRESSLLNPFHFFLFVNLVLWVWVSESRVVISCILSLLISGFLLMSSPVNVGHIDRTMLNVGVLFPLFLLAFYYYLFNLSLYLSSLASEAHCSNKLVSELVLFSCGFRREIRWEK